MLTAQSIYGQDGERRWTGGGVALGRRLARLLPEDVYDTQPLEGRESKFVLVADLRIDNRDELITELGIPAAQAKTMCDAALLLAAFERWDDACCGHLVGDFAFALWDRKGQRLVLARDFMGSRPLHYHRDDRSFALASMPKGLHALPEVPRAPDEERIAEFLCLFPESGARSFFCGIERVEPGHIVTITPTGLHIRRHWDWPRHTLTLNGPAEYVEAMRHHLDRAVRRQLRGVDRQVASHLSAGLDSSAVTTTAARLLAPSGGKVVAFTAVPRVGYDLPVPNGRIGDEGPLAAMTAARYPNIEHVLVYGGDRSPLVTLDRSFFLFDRPVLNLCNLVSEIAINDAARDRGLRVLLTGSTGNVTISYDGNEVLAELIGKGQWAQWALAITAIMRRRHWRLRGAMAASFGPWFNPLLWHLAARLFQGQSLTIRNYSAINPTRLAQLRASSRADGHGLDFTHRPWKNGLAARLWMLSRVDEGNYNKGILGGWGIDVRDPTADRRLAEFCLAVPAEQFFGDGTPRSLARAALADRVPPEVLSEPRSGLWRVDWHEGLTTARLEIAEEISRLERTAPAVCALDLRRMRELTESWPKGGWERKETIEQYRLALLRGISVGHFLRRASGGNL